MTCAGREAALLATQDAATYLLYAEARLGEMLAEMPKPKFDKAVNGSGRGTTGTLPEGIDKKSTRSRAIAENFLWRVAGLGVAAICPQSPSISFFTSSIITLALASMSDHSARTSSSMSELR